MRISSYGTREDCNGVCFCPCLLKCAASTSHTPLPFLTGILAAYLAWPTWIFIYSFHMNAVFFIDLFYKCWWQKVFVWTVFSFFFKLLFSCFKKKKKKAVAFGGNVCLSSDLILRMIIMVLNVFQLVGYIAKKMVQGDLRIRGSNYCCQI